MRAEAHFRAMGTTALVSLVGGDGALVEHAIGRIEDLEGRWTRFNEDSELSRLGAAWGKPVAVSQETFQLVAAACEASRLTSGRFDPTVRDAMIANGYDRTFAEMGERTMPTADPRPAPGIAGVCLDSVARTVTLPPGVGIDPGGIGKGLAADIVTDELLQLGAQGVLVDIGGDICCRGEGPGDGKWVVDVAQPFGDLQLLHLALSDAGIATSSCLRRRWGPDLSLHHIVDPATGRPTATRLVAATVIDAEAWRAEARATAVIVAGDIAAAGGASVIALDDEGAVYASHDLLELVA